MNELDLKTIARLAGYNRLNESTTYPVDFGSKPGPADVNSDHNQTNGMGDNPMKEPVQEDMAPSSIQLSKLHHILKGMGVLDSDIAMGEVIMPADQASKILKVALGVEVAPDAAMVKMSGLVDQLGKRIMGHDDPVADESQLQEFMDIPVGSRFSYVLDAFGTVNVYDGDSGTAVELTGQDAVELVGQLDQAEGDDAKVQDILAQYQHVMEDGEEVVEGPEVDSMLERLEAVAAELTSIMESATAVPANNVTDWHKQNMAEIDLEKVLYGLNQVISTLKSQ